jgi:hypothetical protein
MATTRLKPQVTLAAIYIEKILFFHIRFKIDKYEMIVKATRVICYPVVLFWIKIYNKFIWLLSYEDKEFSKV